MIGEDFRSQAHGNLLYAQELEHKIDLLNQDIKNMAQKVDDKDMEVVLKDRECETFQMQSEETLVHYTMLRDNRDEI